MQVVPRTVEVAPQSIESNPLLDSCRKFKSPAENSPDFSLPPWVQYSGGEFRLLWFPRGKSIDKKQSVFLVEDSEHNWRRLTLLVWQRLETISPLEKAFLLNYFLEETDISRQKVKRNYMELLELPGAEEWLEVYQFISDFPKPLQNRVQTGDFSPRLARHLLELPDQIRGLLVDLLSEQQLYLTVQQGRKLREALRRLPDAKLEKVQGRLETDPEESIDPRQRSSTLLEFVEELAYPRLQEYRRDFEATKEKLNLDPRLRITPPNNFEGDYLDFAFRCHRDESLSGLVDSLRKCEELFKHV